MTVVPGVMSGAMEKSVEFASRVFNYFTKVCSFINDSVCCIEWLAGFILLGIVTSFLIGFALRRKQSAAGKLRAAATARCGSLSLSVCYLAGTHSAW